MGGAIGMIAEMGSMIQGAPGSLARFVAYGLVAVLASAFLITSQRTEPPLAAAFVAFGSLSLLSSAGVAGISGLDPGTVLAFLILLAIVYMTTRRSRTMAPIAVGSGLIALFSVATVLLAHPPLAPAASMLLVGIPGQVLAIWLTWRVIGSLAVTSELAATHSRIQQALARCSQALLTGRDQQPLTEALRALLDATEADYAYIDVNRVDRNGKVTWEIVADATGPNEPEGRPDMFFEGDYDQLEDISKKLADGEPAQIVVSDLPRPIRDRYEAEGTRSELMAPIFIRDQWVGTLGFSDFWREGTWLPVEVEALTRAADMVGAFWEREHAREGLEELAAAKDRFIATVSHELRTPLAAVVGFAGELANGLSGYSAEEVAEMVQLISTQSVEVAQLVDDLLTAERAASGNLTVKPTSLDLLEESRSIVESMRIGLEISVEGEPTPAWADTLRTRQIVRNLLTNASRYGGSNVKLAVSSLGNNAVLVVSDDGPGINVVDSEKIFDPYYRAQSAQGRPDSVGLGLAVARQLARMMGGDLVYRRRSGWTRFELTLPTGPEAAGTATRGASLATPA